MIPSETTWAEPDLRQRLLCLLNILITFALLLGGFFALYVLGLGHPPGEYIHEVLVASFAITAHLTAERWVRRVARLSRSRRPGIPSSEAAD